MPASLTNMCSFVHYACNLDLMVHAIESKTFAERVPFQSSCLGWFTLQQRTCLHIFTLRLLLLAHLS